jgi:outer membrane protein assembly factor BamB
MTAGAMRAVCWTAERWPAVASPVSSRQPEETGGTVSTMPAMSILGPHRSRAAARARLILVAVGAATAVAACGSSKTTNSSAPTRPAASPHHGPAVDTFRWPTYGYNAARTRFYPDRSVAPPFRRTWSYQDYGLLEFPPVMYHNALYFIDIYGSAKSLNKLTGHLFWQRKVGTLAAASPAYDATDKLVFYPLLSETPGAKVGGNGRFVALSMRTGKTVWSHPFPQGSESSPLVIGNNVYVGDGGGNVYSFRAKDGHVNWIFHASGAVKGGVAYAAGNLYFGDYASRVYAVNAATGHEVWSTTTNGGAGTFYGSPAVAFGKVFIGNTDHDVYALSQSSGQLLWTAPTSAYVYSSPAVANVPGLGPTVYTGSYDGNFYALSANTGAVRWRHSSGGRISGSGTIIGNVIYYSVLGTRVTYGLNIRTGKQVFTFPDGLFAGAVADRHALYTVGYSIVYRLLPKHK